MLTLYRLHSSLHQAEAAEARRAEIETKENGNQAKLTQGNRNQGNRNEWHQVKQISEGEQDSKQLNEPETTR